MTPIMNNGSKMTPKKILRHPGQRIVLCFIENYEILTNHIIKQTYVDMDTISSFRPNTVMVDPAIPFGILTPVDEP